MLQKLLDLAMEAKQQHSQDLNLSLCGSEHYPLCPPCGQSCGNSPQATLRDAPTISLLVSENPGAAVGTTQIRGQENIYFALWVSAKTTLRNESLVSCSQSVVPKNTAYQQLIQDLLHQKLWGWGQHPGF